MAKGAVVVVALSALVLAAGGCSAAETGARDAPNPDADLKGGALDTCDVTWSCLHYAAVAAEHSLLAPSGGTPTDTQSGVYYYDAKGSFVMNLSFHPTDLLGSTATYIATRGPRLPLPSRTGGTPLSIRGTTGALQQWPGGGSLTWSQGGWSYKLAIGDARSEPLSAQQVITTLTNHANHLSPTS